MTNRCALAVDDEEDILALLQLVLEMEGYEVRTAPNGLEALDTLKTFQPHLILLDLMMPKMDGYSFIREIRREDSPYAHIPIVVLSADVHAQAKVEQMNIKHFVLKPFDITTLTDKIAYFSRLPV